MPQVSGGGGPSSGLLLDESAFRTRSWAPVEWLRERPRLVDALVVLASLGPLFAALALQQPPRAWIGYAVVAGAAAALWWRRERPFLVLVAFTTLISLVPLSQIGFGDFALPGLESVAVVYTVAAWRPVRTALLGYVAATMIPAVLFGLQQLLGAATALPALVSPFLLVALAWGIAARARREQRQALASLVNARIHAAALSERQRITAQMHDVVAHSLTVMVALAGGARLSWQQQPERAARALEQLSTVGSDALGEMQRILRILQEDSPEFDPPALQPALSELVALFRSAGLPVRLVQQADAESTDPEVRAELVRIAQEALTNALRYAWEPDEVVVQLRREGASLVLEVRDDGAVRRGRRVGAGMGLASIAQRTAALGGSSSAGPLPGGGWLLRATLPEPRPAGVGSSFDGAPR